METIPCKCIMHDTGPLESPAFSATVLWLVAHLFGRLMWITKPCLTIERYALKDVLSGWIPSLNGPESRVLSKPRPILARAPLQ